MKLYQKGEVMLVMMVVMLLAIVLLRDGHMGMMGHSSGHAEKPAEAAQQTKAVTSSTAVSNESTE